MHIIKLPSGNFLNLSLVTLVSPTHPADVIPDIRVDLVGGEGLDFEGADAEAILVELAKLSNRPKPLEIAP